MWTNTQETEELFVFTKDGNSQLKTLFFVQWKHTFHEFISFINTENILNRRITKFYNGNGVMWLQQNYGYWVIEKKRRFCCKFCFLGLLL